MFVVTFAEGINMTESSGYKSRSGFVVQFWLPQEHESKCLRWCFRNDEVTAVGTNARSCITFKLESTSTMELSIKGRRTFFESSEFCSFREHITEG